MATKLYKYGKDKLSMKVLKNLHEVIDFVNPNNKNLKQGTIRQRIVSTLKKGTLFPGAKPDHNRWKPIRRNANGIGTNGRNCVTVAQRIKGNLI